MSKFRYTLACCALVLCFFFAWKNGSAQVNFTANNLVKPYTGGFHPSANIGEYTSFTEEELALLAAGGGEVSGAGVKALRPGLFEGFMEVAGYDAKLPAFQYFQQLGMDDHTVIVGFPSAEHKDATQYCLGIPSEMFANLYEPIWDGGANGTPYNDNNYYAAYLWKTVNLYKPYVRFWEIWNEPGYDYTGGLGFLPPGAEGNWWDNNPDPCDYKLRAPIFHYVRLLRISWEIIKTLDSDAYVVVSGTGFPSFLDAILRNTDNPADGSLNAAYPQKGGAYFDVMGFHSYPHFDGSLQVWSDSLNDWIYSRHSDAAAQGLIKTQDAYQNVLDNYGYNGSTYPEKLWMVTEVNLPRKPFGNYIGSAEAQRNFIIKAMATAMMNDFLQLHIYKLAEDTYLDNAYSEFDLMGLYKRLDYNHANFQELNDEGIAHKTASDVLFKKTFDPVRTGQMNLPGTIGGGAFKDVDSNFTYVLWAKTVTDQSENASANYSFPAGLNVSNLLHCEWDASRSHNAVSINSTNIPLTGSPVFLTERIFSMNDYSVCAPFNLQLTAQVNGATQWLWKIELPGAPNVNFSTQNPTLTLTAEGVCLVTLTAKNAAGQVLAQQTQSLFVKASPQPQFTFEASGPIVHFENNTPLNAENYAPDGGDGMSFSWQFGDGQTSQDAVPTHVFLESGSYTVTLTATNSCGSQSISHVVNVVSPASPQGNTANDSIPVFTGKFRPGTSWDYIPGWTDEQVANITAGNPLEAALNPPQGGAGGVTGIGIKAIRTYTGENAFLDLGYDTRLPEFAHFENLDLRDNSFLLAFPSAQSRDPYFHCPENQSILFKNLYLDIWDGGANGTPVNDENPFALYIWNTVSRYKDHVRFWEIYNSPDYDPTGDYGWLPPGELGNWWENDPDPCNYELRAPIFYYIRSLRIAYEVIHFCDPEAYVTLSGLAYPSFLDAVCRNTDNPLDGTSAAPYPLKGGAYFDAVGFKSYPHFDGSTIYFDVSIGQFAYERHSDAAVDGIARVKNSFETVLKNYGYDGTQFPDKEWIISEANIPRKQFYDYLGSAEAQRNWVVKAWVESVKNGVRQLGIFRLAESQTFAEAGDPFEMMGFYQKMDGVTPYHQVVNEQGVALKTCSDLLFGADFSQQKTAAMNLPDGVRGAAFQDAAGNFIYVLWAETETDQSEAASATYSFPTSFGISQLHRRAWDFSLTGQSGIVSPNNLALTGSPVFLTQTLATLTPPVAFFEADVAEICPGASVNFTSHTTGNATHWEWIFEGGTPAAHFGEAPPAVTYFLPGKYEVSLLAKNAAGEHVATYQNYITVNALPDADFQTVIAGATVQFVNLSDVPTGGGGVNFEWCYGDGYCNFSESPSYTYFQNGTYLVTLTASNICGKDSFEQTIIVGAAPTAVFHFEHNSDCEMPVVQFLDFSYSDPENWHWEFPGGEPAASDLRYPVVHFPAGGWYEITLVAGNSIGFDTLIQPVFIEGKSTTNVDVSLCEGGVYEGTQIFSDTVVTVVHPTWSLGCDSTIVATIDVTSLIETQQSLTFCEGEIFHGLVLTQDTVFVETFALQAGCDSISTTTVAVFLHEEVFLTETIAEGEFVQVGNSIFTDAGNYSVLLETWQGCDSLVHLDLTMLTGTRDFEDKALNVRVFPNPFSEMVWVEFELVEAAKVSVEIFDGWGRKVRTHWMGEKLGAGTHRVGMDLEEVPAGIYGVRVSSKEGSFFLKIVKI